LRRGVPHDGVESRVDKGHARLRLASPTANPLRRVARLEPRRSQDDTRLPPSAAYALGTRGIRHGSNTGARSAQPGSAMLRDDESGPE
jgi:hypothetical protein